MLLACSGTVESHTALGFQVEDQIGDKDQCPLAAKRNLLL
jgi:hypothetical protein